MKHLKSIAFGVLAAWAASAPAAVITYDQTVDLTTATMSGVFTEIALQPAPLTVRPGDTLQGTISFLPGQAVTITDEPASPGPGWEYVLLDIRSTTADASIQGFAHLSFTGITGSYVGPATAQNGTGGGLSASTFGNLTNSAFSFTGLSYSIDYTSGSATQFSPFMLTLAYDVSFGGAVSPLPEPASWAMMIGGFGAIGAAMRRRRPSIA